MEKIIQPISSAEEIAAAQAADQANRLVASPPSTPSQSLTQGTPEQPAPTPASVAEVANDSSQPYQTPYIARMPSDISEDTRPQHLPRGVYVIAGLCLLNLVAGLILGGPSSHSALYWVAGIVDVLLVAGLLTASNLARKIVVGMSILIAISSLLMIVNLSMVQGRYRQAAQRAQTAIAARQQKGGLSQKDAGELKSASQKVSNERAELDRLYTRAYWREGLAMLYSVIVVSYLMSPAVKRSFH